MAHCSHCTTVVYSTWLVPYLLLAAVVLFERVDSTLFNGHQLGLYASHMRGLCWNVVQMWGPTGWRVPQTSGHAEMIRGSGQEALNSHFMAVYPWR